MANASTTITTKEVSNGVKIVSVSFVADDATGAFTNATLPTSFGRRLHSVVIIPGDTGPTVDSDLSITDSVTTLDLVSSNGTNAIKNAKVTNIVADDLENIITGSLTVSITNNSVNSAELTLKLLFIDPHVEITGTKVGASGFWLLTGRIYSDTGIWIDTATWLDEAGPEIILDWPLTSTTTPTIAEDATATFTRASTAWYIPAGSSIWTQVAVDTARFEDAGFLYEPQRTNLALHSQDFTNDVWVKSNMAVTGNTETGGDGTTTADTITATASNATILQTITSTAADRIFSIFIKRKTGSGDIYLTLNGGTNWTLVSPTSELTRFEVQLNNLTNPQLGIRIVSNGDELYVWQAQCENARQKTSIIPTTSSQVTRASDSLTLPAADGTNFRNEEGMFFADITYNGSRHAVDFFAVTVGTPGGNLLKIGSNRILASDGTTTVQHSGDSWSIDNFKKVFTRWNTSESDLQVGFDGTSGSVGNYDGDFGIGSTFVIGHSSSSPFHIKNIKVYSQDKGQAFGEQETS